MFSDNKKVHNPNITTSFNMSNIIDHIESMNSTKLNPKVLEDMSLIADHFQYNVEVNKLLQYIVSECLQYNQLYLQ